MFWFCVILIVLLVAGLWLYGLLNANTPVGRDVAKAEAAVAKADAALYAAVHGGKAPTAVPASTPAEPPKA